MAELRHATAAARASDSPAKRDAEAASASSLFVASPRGGDGKDGAPRPSLPFHQRCPLPSPVRSLLALEDPRSPSASASYRILVAIVACLVLAALFSAPSFWSRLNAPYLCRKDGIRLHCPRVNERDSLWENPHAAATSWKPCAERRSEEISGLKIQRWTEIYAHAAKQGTNAQTVKHKAHMEEPERKHKSTA